MCDSCYSDYKYMEKQREATDPSNKVSFPICGRSTDKSQIDWQGMCKSCYNEYQELKKLYGD